jgi:DNA-binding transcriptional LysR family regulator
MTLEQIRMFVAIAETGSLGSAAKILHRTQPTLSVSIKNLETDLGIQIFSREGYRMALSSEGRALLEKAKKILRQTDDLENLAQYLVQDCEAELKIAFDPIIPIRSFLELLKQCEMTYPMTKLTLNTEYLRGGLEQLMADQVDFAVITMPQIDTRLETIPLQQVAFTRVATPDFPPLQTGTPITFELLESFIQVVIKGSTNKSNDGNYGVLEGGRQWRVSEMQTKKEIILAGMGWGGLPNYLIEEELKRGDLVPIKIQKTTAQINIETALVRKSSIYHGKVASYLWTSCMGSQYEDTIS